MDTTQDTSGSLNDGRWLTYREIAQARGIDVPSAVKLSRRQHWRRQAGNRNTVRIFVPLDWLSGDNDPESKDETGDTPRGDPGTSGPGRLLASTFETALAAIEAAHARELATLKEQVASAEQARLGMKAMVEQFAGQLRGADETMKAERAASQDAITAERQRADDLRAQIDVLNAELVATGAEADRTMADERMRADRLNERVDALSADLTRAEADRRVAEVRADKAETAIAAERARADALRTAIDELKAGQALMADIHARDLAMAQHDAQVGQQAAAKAEQGEKAERERAAALLEATQKELAGQQTLADAARQDAQAVQEWAAELRLAEVARKARGRLRRAWDGWWGR